MTAPTPTAESWDQYGNYLQLEKILDAQSPLSNRAGDPIHDEMLFIQFHQINELWFKQILFELTAVQEKLSHPVVQEHQMQPILLYLGRIVEIFKQLEGMIDVLETMPAQSFIDFRNYLGTASGFQSLQFRLIETRIGLQRTQRLAVFNGAYDAHLCPASKHMIHQEEKCDSLFEQLDSWLSRTPFVNVGSYRFWDEYISAVHNMFDERRITIQKHLPVESQAGQLDMIVKGQEKFKGIFDEHTHKKAREEGKWRLSWRALQAALFISVYRSEPALQAPYSMLTRLIEIDELLARWRFRHALMVQRMVGHDKGTGGSSGYEYLMNTVAHHRIFSDLYSLSSYLLPTKVLPPLPCEVQQDMNFQFCTKVYT